MFILGSVGALSPSKQFRIIPGLVRDSRAHAGAGMGLGNGRSNRRRTQSHRTRPRLGVGGAVNLFLYEMQRLDHLRNLLDGDGDKCNIGQPGFAVRRSGFFNGLISALGSPALSEDALGRLLMAQSPDDRVTLGRLLASMENLTTSHRESREEGRERDAKLAKIVDAVAGVKDQIRDVSREGQETKRSVNESIREIQNSHKQSSQILTSGLDLVNIQIKKLEAHVDTTTSQIEKLATEQTKIRTEVAEVKADTHKLQAPVNQLVGIRRAIIAWGGGVIVVTGYLFWLFRAAWDDLIHHFMTNIGVK